MKDIGTTTGTPARAEVLSERGVIRSEWIKFRSVPSLPVALAAAFAVAVFFGVLFSSFAESSDGPGGGGPGPQLDDPVSLSLSGFNLAVVIVGVLGVLVVTSDYGPGVIRATLAAVPRRLMVLRAKVVVFTAVALPAMMLAATIAFVGGSAVYGGDAPVPSLTDADVLRSVFGTAAYTTAAGLMGVALGFLLRGPAAAIGVLIAGLLVLPGLSGLLPGAVGDNVTKLLPSNAASAFTSVAGDSGAELLSAAAGAAVLAMWVVVLLASAGYTLQRRDV